MMTGIFALSNAARSLALLAPSLAFPALAHAHPDPDAFSRTAFVDPPATVECTLEDGTETTCHELILSALPGGLEIGPFCPATLDETGGIWDWDGAEAGLYRIDRAFLEMLAEQGFRFFDESGAVAIGDPGEGQPDAEHACLSASLKPDVTMTIRIPAEPRMADAPTPLGTVAKIGVALDGVPIFADAPSVLDTGHMPALDTCGGHVDPGGWYHWHATSTDVDTVLDREGVEAGCGAVAQDASAQFGYALDGYPMFGGREADGSVPEDLDECGGHVGPTSAGETYHYHARETFPNLPSCLVGVVAEDNFTTTADRGIGSLAQLEGGRPTDGPGGMPPGFARAAETLGVEPEVLMEAVRAAGGPRANLAAAAATLGVTEEALREALPPPRRDGPRPEGPDQVERTDP